MHKLTLRGTLLTATALISALGGFPQAQAQEQSPSCETVNNFQKALGDETYQRYGKNEFSAATQNDLEFCVYYATGNVLAARYGVQVSRLSIARLTMEAQMSKKTDAQEHKASWDDIGGQGSDASEALPAIQGQPLCLEKALPSSPSILLTSRFVLQPGRPLGSKTSKEEIKAAFNIVEKWQQLAKRAHGSGARVRITKQIKTELAANKDLFLRAFPDLHLADVPSQVWKGRNGDINDILDAIDSAPMDGLSDSYAQLRKLQQHLHELKIPNETSPKAHDAQAWLAAQLSQKDSSHRVSDLTIDQSIYFGNLDAPRDVPALRLFPNLYGRDVAQVVWHDRDIRFTKLLGDLERRNCGENMVQLPKLEWESFDQNLVAHAHEILNKGDIAIAESDVYGHDMTLIGRESIGGQCYMTILNNWGQGACKNPGIVNAAGVDNLICRQDGTLLVSEKAFPSFIATLVHLK